MRRAPDRLDPPDLHRRLGKRGLRRGKPIVLSRAAELAEALGLDDDELCTVLDADPLTLVGGDLDHRPEVGILLDLLAEARERVSPAVLRRWVRSRGSAGRPLDMLLARDFRAFEDALADLVERGFVLRS